MTGWKEPELLGLSNVLLMSFASADALRMEQRSCLPAYCWHGSNFICVACEYQSHMLQ